VMMDAFAEAPSRCQDLNRSLFLRIHALRAIALGFVSSAACVVLQLALASLEWLFTQRSARLPEAAASLSLLRRGVTPATTPAECHRPTRRELEATHQLLTQGSGLGSLTAAVTHAPWMAAFMTVELTGQWHVLVPILACCFLSSQMAAALSSRSLYGIATPTPTEEGVGAREAICR
jgi:H+/Cl- antiporter ClcA